MLYIYTGVYNGILALLYFFSDIPPDVDSMTISVLNAAKRSKHPLGEATIHFRKLSSGKPVEDW